MRNNPRLHLPRARPSNEEIELSGKAHTWKQATLTYMENNCDSKGRQLEGNLTPDEVQGTNSFNERTKAGEIVISTTDKSNLTTISSHESYIAQGTLHTQKDRLASWEEFHEAKNLVLCHTLALTNVFKIGSGQSQNEEQRVRLNMMENITTVPQASLMQKDHKPPHPDGTPKTRFLCHASMTYNQRLADLTNDICKGMIDSDTTEELNSSEDFLSVIEELNLKIKQGEIDPNDLVIGSLDVENLYGSMNCKKASEIIRNRAKKTKLKVENIDWRWALIYLALTLSPHDIVDQKLQQVIPKRAKQANGRKAPGKPPTILTAEVDMKKERWRYPTPPQC